MTLQKIFTIPTVVGLVHTHYASGFIEASGVISHGGTLAVTTPITCSALRRDMPSHY
jgi:hypothetical protein